MLLFLNNRSWKYVPLSWNRNLSQSKKNTLMLFQTINLKIVLKWFGISDYSLISTSMNSGLPNMIMSSSPDYQVPPNTIFWYTSAAGFLIYAMIMTQLDIAFVLLIISCYYNNPDSIPITAITQVLWYIKGTLNNGIVFCKELDTELDLIRYTDTDYGLVKDERKLISRLLFCLGRGPISWNSKKQSVVAFSSYKIKYIALNKANKEAI